MPPPPTISPPPLTPRARTRNQLSLFFAGAAFLGLSTFITRRSLLRRYKATAPRFYQPSNRPPATAVNGGMEAFEALNIATLHVCSVAMMVGGGTLWAFDVWGMEDLRGRVRGALGFDAEEGRSAEEEFEEWIAVTLERGRRREGRGKGEEGGEEEGKER